MLQYKTKRFDSTLILALTLFAVGACGDSASRMGEPGTIAPALDEAFRQASRLDRIAGLSNTLLHLDAENLDEAKQVYEREFWWIGDTEIELFMEALTRIDPAAARDYAGYWPERTRRPVALAAVVRAWALQDPKAAVTESKKMGDAYPKLRGTFVENLLSGWVQSGIPGVVDHVAKGNKATYPMSAVYLAGGQTRRLGTPAVLDWADGIVQGQYKDELKLNIFRRTTGTAARLDPSAVAAWVKKHEGESYTSEASRILIERWIPIDAEAAMDWVEESIPPDEQEPLIRTGFTKWITRDFDRAGEWVKASPTAARYDPAFRAYAVILAQRSGEEAIPWAERILDDESRLVTLARVAGSWYRRDPVAAEAWLQTSELDEDARAEVRRSPGKRRVSPLKES